MNKLFEWLDQIETIIYAIAEFDAGDMSYDDFLLTGGRLKKTYRDEFYTPDDDNLSRKKPVYKDIAQELEIILSSSNREGGIFLLKRISKRLVRIYEWMVNLNLYWKEWKERPTRTTMGNYLLQYPNDLRGFVRISLIQPILFGINILDICTDLNIGGKAIKLDIPKELLLFHNVLKRYEQNNSNDELDKNCKYKTLPRTHRIAAVWGVINKLNLQAHMDKTNLAAFVEAVTGGNIECKPKDTVSYKEPEKTAKEAADEWLKKIGVK